MLDNKFQKIDSEVKQKDSVISFPSPLMLKINDLMIALRQAMRNNILDDLYKKLEHRGCLTTNKEWFTKGVECEILDTDGKGWKKGKVRIQVSLEFQPDEPEIEAIETNPSESSLDDIRRKLNQIN